MGFFEWVIDPQRKVAYAIKFELTNPEESFGIKEFVFYFAPLWTKVVCRLSSGLSRGLGY
jgi:hypothetical protein